MNTPQPQSPRRTPLTDPLAYSGLAVKSSNITGTRVINLQQEDIGHVEDVVIDSFNGKVAYLIVGYGGVLGLGEKQYAVPWKAVHYDRTLEAYVLNVTRDQIEHAPGFDNEAWQAGDEGWNQRIHDYYNVPPYWGI